MSITTNQTISRYYELFGKTDITLTKEIGQVLGHMPQACYLKCVGEQWPCVVYSTSMTGAKVVANITAAITEKIAKANNSVSIRFSFRVSDKADPVTFFIASKVIGFAPYNNAARPDMKLISFQYTQKPPDFLIDVLGKFVEANVNSAKRSDERILLTQDVLRKMRISKDAAILIQGVPRKCILRDLSFSGSKFIIMGLAKFLVGKEAILRIEADEPRESWQIKGMTVRFEEVEGRKDLTALAMKFDANSVPMGFKMRLNDMISTAKKPLADPDQSKPSSHQTQSQAKPATAPQVGAEPDAGLPSQPVPSAKRG